MRTGSAGCRDEHAHRAIEAGEEIVVNAKIDRLAPSVRASIATAAIIGVVLLLSACATPSGDAAPSSTAALEEIYILRSIREQHQPVANWCSSARTGFEPFPADAERFFSFWSLRVRSEDGKVVETKDTRVAELRACFGATSELARQNFYAEIKLGSRSFRGIGECLALEVDFPESGLFPVRCQLVLSGLPAPYVGGLLTTNTITSQAAFGGDTVPPGYTQASIATIRLWTSH
jgi:hypothetical protein